LSAATLAAVPAAQAGRVERIEAELAAAQYVPGEFLVQYRPGADRGMQADARSRVAAERVESVAAESRRNDGGGELELVRIPPGVGLATAIDRIMEDPAVEFAEPNWIYYHDATSNDPYYTNGSLWGMYGDASSPANQYGSQAGEAWANGKTDCSSVYVGIIDEGYMYTHEDLAANAGTNPGEIAGNGVDDDGNGYKDDVYGWDFDGRNNSVYDGTQDDHGTHVAGTIGGVGGNAKGVAGVCWNIKLMNAKFLGRAGGTTANAIKAVDYFTDLKTRRGLNLVATNNSWGGGGFSQSLKDAIDRAGAADILFIAAAGNGGSDGVGDNNDATPHYPSSYTSTNVIAVASITSTGAKSSWSNYGVTSVDIGAPGSGIYSTLPYKSGAAKYGSYSGTSMATPHVTGAVALYAATHAGVSAAEIRAAIMDSAVATPSLDGMCVTGGRLNVSDF
jgi:subtilisin family serine protease